MLYITGRNVIPVTGERHPLHYGGDKCFELKGKEMPYIKGWGNSLKPQ